MKCAAETDHVTFIKNIVSQAILLGASDVHFFPSEKSFKIQFRVKTELIDYKVLSPGIFTAISYSLIDYFNLDPARISFPQDSSIQFNADTDIRVSLVPLHSNYFKIVTRILNQSKVSLPLHTLNIPCDFEASFINALRSKSGIILLSGPTGSGKTTTLFSAINHIKHNPINIFSFEDPIEYKIQGITQLEIKKNLNFENSLRHILRQDPDVIILGEIRDQITAKFAIEASNTGHLVISTIHANSVKVIKERLSTLGVSELDYNENVIFESSQALYLGSNGEVTPIFEYRSYQDDTYTSTVREQINQLTAKECVQ